MEIEPVRPNITFFSLPNVLAAGLFTSAILGALSWFWMEILGFEYSKIVGTFAGTTWFLIVCWFWWSWRSTHKYARWHRWFSRFAYVLYLGGYFYLAGVVFWSATLGKPWNSVIIGSLFTLYAFVLTLPVLMENLAKKLYMLHDDIDRRFLGCGGGGMLVLAGIIGYWLSKTLGTHLSMTLIAILGPILGLGLSQRLFFELWQTRPWAKEEKA